MSLEKVEMTHEIEEAMGGVNRKPIHGKVKGKVIELSVENSNGEMEYFEFPLHELKNIILKMYSGE